MEEAKHQLQWAEFKSEIINTPRVQLKRFDDGVGNRFYYHGEPGNINLAIGITSLLSAVMPESSFLTNWKLKHGDNWKKVLNDAASYGTLMHAIYGEWIVNKKIPKELLDSAKKICLTTGKSVNMPEKDLLAFLQFCEDYNVKPLVLEGLLLSEPTFGGQHYAMAIDFLCSMTVDVKTKETVEDGEYVRGDKKGEKKYKEVTTVTKKNIIASIDFKSNFFEKETKSFFDSHKYQLIGAKRAIKYNFDLDVDAVYNFSPNAWRTSPTYSLKEWEITNKDESIFDAYVNIAELTGVLTPRGSIFQAPEFNETTKASDFRIINYQDFVSNNGL